MGYYDCLIGMIVKHNFDLGEFKIISIDSLDHRDIRATVIPYCNKIDYYFGDVLRFIQQPKIIYSLKSLSVR